MHERRKGLRLDLERYQRFPVTVEFGGRRACGEVVNLSARGLAALFPEGEDLPGPGTEALARLHAPAFGPTARLPCEVARLRKGGAGTILGLSFLALGDPAKDEQRKGLLSRMLAELTRQQLASWEERMLRRALVGWR